MGEYSSKRVKTAGLTRRDVLIGTTSAAVTSLAGCLSDDNNDAGPVRVGLNSDPAGGDWGQYGGVVPYYTPFQETLTAAPPDLNGVDPNLATDWEHRDKTTWQFELREGVSFHDGTELTADVAADALAALIEAHPIGFTRFEPDSFSAVGEYELEIETTQPEPATPGNLAHPLMSLQHPDADEPVGTGPYRVESVEAEAPVEAEIFEEYWADSASVPLVFEGVTDPQTRTLQLESGELDVAFDLPRGRYDDLRENDELTARTRTEPRTGMIMVNKYRGPTADRDLRRALLYATDQQELVVELLDDVGELARSPFSKVIEWSAHGELSDYTDMERARELRERSGYEGEPLRFIISGSESEQQLIAEELQRRWAKIDIEVDIEQVEPAAFFSQYQGGEADLAFVELGSINGAADYLVYVMFHSEGGDNRQQFENDGTGVVNPGEGVDELIEKGDTAFDEAAKHDAYREVQHRVMDEGVTIPIYYKEYVLGTRGAIEGPDLHAIPHMTDWTTLDR